MCCLVGCGASAGLARCGVVAVGMRAHARAGRCINATGAIWAARCALCRGDCRKVRTRATSRTTSAETAGVAPKRRQLKIYAEPPCSLWDKKCNYFERGTCWYGAARCCSTCRFACANRKGIRACGGGASIGAADRAANLDVLCCTVMDVLMHRPAVLCESCAMLVGPPQLCTALTCSCNAHHVNTCA